MKTCFLTGILLFISGICSSQNAALFPVIDNQDLPDAKSGTPKTYNGSSLFGLIDGGAELFLEYGFEAVWTNQVTLSDETYKVEIYKMTGAEEAFGIYSISRYQCESNPPVSVFACQTRYQLQFCSGPFYVSIVNSNGTSKDSLACLQIASVLASKIQETPVDLDSFMPGKDASLISQNAILVKGNLGIMNSVPDLADFFGEAKNFTSLILKENEKTMVSLRFLKKEDLLEFIDYHQWDISNPSTLKDKEISKISDLQLLIIL